jgi:putative sterol carrier protein
MVDIEALKAKYVPKLEAEELEWTEVPEVMDLLCAIANSDEDFEEEFGSFTKTYQFKVTDIPDGDMWLKIEGGKFSSGAGLADPINLTFSMTKECAAGMVSGAVDSNSAFMKGELKLDGPIGDGVKFQNILALFKDVLDI